jgi:hypothetical protein
MIQQFVLQKLYQLYIVLDGLPDRMKVEIAPEVNLSAKTVGELRRLENLPSAMRITMPSNPYAGRVKIEPYGN